MNPSFSEESYTPDRLFAGDFPRQTRDITVISGQNLLRGTLLGKVTLGALTAAGAAGTPAPAGATITAAPTTTGATKVGVHTFSCVVGGAATASKWQHEDPEGDFVGTASGNTAYSGQGLGLTITDSGTDPSVGEQFIVTVTAVAGSGKYNKSLAAATDGSQVPIAILANDVDASGGDKGGICYLSGDFNSDSIVFGTGHTVASTTVGLRDQNIYLKSPVSA